MSAGMRALRKTSIGISQFVWMVILVMLITVEACTISSGHIPTIPVKALSAIDAYPLAWAEAQKWRPDAYLVSIEADVHYAQDPSPLYIFFNFDALDDPYIWLSVKCWKGESGFEVRNETGRYTYPIPDKVPIGRGDWTVDSLEALDTAQHNGGNAFIYRLQGLNNVLPSYLLKLERDLPPNSGDVMWTASYVNLAGQERLGILIDAKTGEIRKMEQQP